MRAIAPLLTQLPVVLLVLVWARAEAAMWKFVLLLFVVGLVLAWVTAGNWIPAAEDTFPEDEGSVP
jgi:hypothetical protein